MFLHSGLHQGECLSTEQGVVALRVTMLTQKLSKSQERVGSMSLALYSCTGILVSSLPLHSFIFFSSCSLSITIVLLRTGLCWL